MVEPSETYLQALKLTQHHHAVQNKTFSGQFTWKQRKRIKAVIDRFQVKSICDYGCGKGKQYNPAFNREEDGRTLEEYWGIEPFKYDPGVPKFAQEPEGKFDLVICIQVLASIPKQDLPWVVDRLYGLAHKAVFVAERIKLPNKQIYHSIQQHMPHGISVDEWMDILRRPVSPVRLISAFRTENGWQIEEPDDQGTSNDPAIQEFYSNFGF